MEQTTFFLLNHVCYCVRVVPKNEAKGSWPEKNSLNTSSGLRNVKVNPGKSDEKSVLEEPEESWKKKDGLGARWKEGER